MNEKKVIVFQLNDEEYGVDVHQVKSIERVLPITRIPRTPDFIKGVINLRGIVTPILNLRSRFNMEEIETNENTRIIIVTVDMMEVGLIVDGANDVIDIPVDAIEPPPEVVGGVCAEYIEGVAKLENRLLILLNLEKVLNQQELNQLEQIGSGL
ncbi:chemotaxis protein CheW [Fictibacillus sp. Mic-4]|uniref:chemotaxis protein CheW n=1 Tax=Fictibacillus TaxID=1329200 RepID=UPI0004210016|nr:chemotaxis protein CheW [Fictibacillus gelatini]